MSQIKQGIRVSAMFDGDPYEGLVLSSTDTTAVVRFDDGEELTMKHKELSPLSRGFKQYQIIWHDLAGMKDINFRFYIPVDGQQVEFHGWWRMTETRSKHSHLVAPCYCIDIFCKWSGKSYSMKSIVYFDRDPREDMSSLSADITAAANQFIWQQLNGKMTILDQLTQLASSPIIHVKNLRTLDMLISKLMEHRAASITAGGPRHCDMTSDEPGGPRVTFAIDLTAQHVALEGKVPSLIEGAVYDSVKAKRGERGEKLTLTIDKGNLDSIIKQLKIAKERGDESTARKIRATLRKLGHKGGARSAGGSK